LITLPIYYTHIVKRKKETILVGLNKYERMHYQPRDKLKKFYYDLIRSKIALKPIKGKIATHYTLYYKNKSCDAPNVVAVIDKMFMDALQNHNIIEQDNVQTYIQSSWEVGGQDRVNPRIEVKILKALSYN